MNHTTLAVVAIVAVAALLITATSLGATQAFAKKYKKVSQRSNAEIAQDNQQSATCLQPATVNIVPISCNEIGLNLNVGPATSSNVLTR
jgi:hypothetical protein